MRQSALVALSAVALIFGTTAATAADDGAGVQQPVRTLTDSGVYDILSRIEQLQNEVQQLRGVVEEQSQTIADLQRKQANMYTDLDSRVQGLTPAAASASGAAAAAVPGAVLPGTPAAPAVTAPATPAVPVAAPATAGIVAPPATTPAASAPVSAANERDRYQLAYETLRSGRNEQAVKQFEALLVDYPRGEYADNAQYWLGEAYKVNRETDKARAAFTKVLTQYPNSYKAPDALLKLGYIEFELQNMVKAREIFNRVISTYPGTPAEHLASKKLAQIP